MIAIAAVAYVASASSEPVTAASVGSVAPRSGSSFDSPRVELNVETGDRINWDFRNVESQYRERDRQGDWVNGTHVLQTQYCQGGAHPQDHAMAGKKMADFGLTDVGDNGYLLSGTFKAPPRDSNGNWAHRPREKTINEAGTEKVVKWRMRVLQRSRTDVDESLPTAALKTDGVYAGPKEQCYYGQKYRFNVTHRIRITPTPTTPPDPTSTRVPVPTATRAVTDCSGRKYGNWHGEKGDRPEPYDEAFHRLGGHRSYGDSHCMSTDEREEHRMNTKGTKWTSSEPTPHEH